MKITIEIIDPIAVSVRQAAGKHYSLMVTNEAGEEADVALEASGVRLGTFLETALRCLNEALVSGHSRHIRLDEDSDAVGMSHSIDIPDEALRVYREK